MGVPYGSSIFQLRPDKCAICQLPHAWVFSFDISPDKVKGFCCTARDPIYMGVPGQATGDINPKIPGTCNNFQDATIEIVVCIDWFPGTCHLNYLALRGVELHIPFPLPHRQFVKVMLQNCAVFLTFNSQIQDRVISVHAYFRGYCVR